MLSGNQIHTKHNKLSTTIHVGNGIIELMLITKLTKVVSKHLAVFEVIVQSLFQCPQAAEDVARCGHD